MTCRSGQESDLFEILAFQQIKPRFRLGEAR
jgi:hypothetical protein